MRLKTVSTLVLEMVHQASSFSLRSTAPQVHFESNDGTSYSHGSLIFLFLECETVQFEGFVNEELFHEPLKGHISTLYLEIFVDGSGFPCSKVLPLRLIFNSVFANYNISHFSILLDLHLSEIAA